MKANISQIRAMTIECDKVNGINLAQGICDLDTPEIVKKAAIKAINEGFNTYTRADGLQMLREAVAKKLEKFNQLKVSAEENIIITNGATGGFYTAARAVLEPGDEVIVFEPFYSYHVNTLREMGVNPLFITMNPPDWKYSLETVKISEKTKAIIINTPANPCGKIFSQTEIEELEIFCLKHNLLIFTDEVYEYFIYGDNRHISPASRPALRERTITISSYSKTFSITGWRIGYSVAADPQIAQRIKMLNDLVYVCSPTPLQVAVAEGINDLPDSYYEDLKKELLVSRDQLSKALSRAGFSLHVPDGAYYILADIGSMPGKTSKDKAMSLLQKTGIAAVPGNEFFSDEKGDNFARFCFAKRAEALNRACENLYLFGG